MQESEQALQEDPQIVECLEQEGGRSRWPRQASLHQAPYSRLVSALQLTPDQRPQWWQRLGAAVGEAALMTWKQSSSR